MRILIIDDEENIRRATVVVLEAIGHETVCVESAAAALKQVEDDTFDVAFLDLKLGGDNGLDLLPGLLRLSPQLEVIVFTAYASIETAVEAMRRGAVDYIPKPFTPEQIRQALNRLIQARKLRGRVAELESRLSTEELTIDLATTEPAMQKALDLAFKAAATPATILLLGESGTGKSVVARALHEHSPQKENAFVTVSCPSLSRELLESELFGHAKGAFTGAVSDKLGKVAMANGGTLFLDEIGELPLEIQPKLLRLLQEKEYERVGEAKTRHAHVRVISATNRNLEKAVQEGRFREDLYYRLHVIAVQIPPLAGTSRRPVEDRGTLPAVFLETMRQTARRFFPRGAGAASAIHLAGQPARIAQCDRTNRHSGRCRRNRPAWTCRRNFPRLAADRCRAFKSAPGVIEGNRNRAHRPGDETGLHDE